MAPGGDLPGDFVRESFSKSPVMHIVAHRGKHVSDLLKVTGDIAK
jgi:hypothetical protein